MLMYKKNYGPNTTDAIKPYKFNPEVKGQHHIGIIILSWR